MATSVSPTVSPRSISSPKTILDYLIANEEARANSPDARVVFDITSHITLGTGRVEMLAIGVDNGNDAVKLSMFNRRGELITLRVPMAYRTAKTIQSGAGELTYQMGKSMFWTGETALAHDGGDIPVGPTDQRVVDTRWSRLLASSLAELLHKAGYTPGSYDLALGFAIPNTEIKRNVATNRLGVIEATGEALKEHVRGQEWTVLRSDTDGNTSEWHLIVREIIPQAQSLGTYTVWSKAPNGKTINAVDGVIVIDIGGGDLQVTEISLEPYQMITERVGDGTIAIAKALIEQFPTMQLNNVAAQQGLITQRLMIAGKYADVREQVAEVLGSEGQNIIGQVLPVLRQSRRFVIITGGGVILLHDMLMQRITAARKERGIDYELINHGLASIVNSVGALFAILFKAHRRGN